MKNKTPEKTQTLEPTNEVRKLIQDIFAYAGDEYHIAEQALKTAEARGHIEGVRSERTFILNILDGIDIADEHLGNEYGGTLAIRSALTSRIITPKDVTDKL